MLMDISSERVRFRRLSTYLSEPDLLRIDADAEEEQLDPGKKVAESL
jgi:hypothetical protein